MPLDAVFAAAALWAWTASIAGARTRTALAALRRGSRRRRRRAPPS